MCLLCSGSPKASRCHQEKSDHENATGNSSCGSKFGMPRCGTAASFDRRFRRPDTGFDQFLQDEPWPISLGCEWHVESLGAAAQPVSGNAATHQPRRLSTAIGASQGRWAQHRMFRERRSWISDPAAAVFRMEAFAGPQHKPASTQPAICGGVGCRRLLDLLRLPVALHRP